VTAHRRESWDSGLAGIASALRQIASERLATADFLLHPNPKVAARMRLLLGNCEGIGLREPCDHAAAIAAMLDADLVLSDSGGLQEEASALGVPLLVLRSTSERPEAIAGGGMELVGTDPQRILASVRRLIGDPAALEAMTNAGCPYGDGRASERIAGIIQQWLNERDKQQDFGEESVALPSPARTGCPRQTYGW
jgi:UDP-N-acetylglucosamine 2-epimerase (non-hydrolysing)